MICLRFSTEGETYFLAISVWCHWEGLMMHCAATWKKKREKNHHTHLTVMQINCFYTVTLAVGQRVAYFAVWGGRTTAFSKSVRFYQPIQRNDCLPFVRVQQIASSWWLCKNDWIFFWFKYVWPHILSIHNLSLHSNWFWARFKQSTVLLRWGTGA